MPYFNNSCDFFNQEREIPCVTQGVLSNYQEQQPATTGTMPAIPLPTEMQGGSMYGGVPAVFPTQAEPSAMQIPQTVQNPYYLAGKLRRYIGRDVRVEFLIGTNGPLIDRIGTLLEVGASYIIIRPIRSDDVLICDLYAIKFVSVYQ